MRKVIKARLEASKSKIISRTGETQTSKNLAFLTPIKMKKDFARPSNKSVSPVSFLEKLRKFTPEPDMSAPVISEISFNTISRNSTQCALNSSRSLQKKLVISRKTPIRMQKKTAKAKNEHCNAVNCIEIKGDNLISGSSDYLVKVWDLHNWTGQVECKHKNRVIGVKSLNNKIISISTRGTLKISQNGKLLRNLRSLPIVTCIEILGPNQLLSMGAKIEFWDLEKNSLFRETTEEEGIVSVVSKHTENTFFLGRDNEIQLWDIRASRAISSTEFHKDVITGLLVEPSQIFTCSLDKMLKLWDLRVNKEIFVKKAQKPLEKIIFCEKNLCTAGEELLLWTDEVKVLAKGNFKDIAYSKITQKVYAGESTGKIFVFKI